MPSVLPRVIIAAVAIPLVVWFAVLARDQAIGNRAATRVLDEPLMSDAAWARTIDDLRRAELLNPGTEYRVARAASLLLRDKRAARQVAESILRREPENLGAWTVVLNATRDRNPTRAMQALREIRRLKGSPLPWSGGAAR